MDNYKTIETKLRNRESFRGNSLIASSYGNLYQVVSYDTLIASYDIETHRVWLDDTKYSVTTSRHQNLIKRAWGMV